MKNSILEEQKQSKRVERKDLVILTWEYPPRVIGNISLLVKRLCDNLFPLGINPYVFTFDEWFPGKGKEGNIYVERVSNSIKTHVNVFSWTITLNNSFYKAISDYMYENKKKFDLIHAHEWITCPTAIMLKHSFAIPYVLSLYSLEDHRTSRFFTPYSQNIKDIEWEGIYEAKKIIVHDKRTYQGLIDIHSVPKSKIKLISLNENFDEFINIYEEVTNGKFRHSNV